MTTPEHVIAGLGARRRGAHGWRYIRQMLILVTLGLSPLAAGGEDGLRVSGVFESAEPEVVVSEMARTYGLQVILVREWPLPVGPRAGKSRLGVLDASPEAFMRELDRALPEYGVWRHPEHAVWLVAPREMAWRWLFEERRHPELPPGTAEDRIRKVYGDLPRVQEVPLYGRAAEAPGRHVRGPRGAVEGIVVDPADEAVPELERRWLNHRRVALHPRSVRHNDPEGLPATDGPVWHRLAEILAREPRTYMVIQRGSRLLRAREAPEEEADPEPFVFWCVGASADFPPRTPAEIIADWPRISREENLGFHLRRMPEAHLAEIEREAAGAGSPISFLHSSTISPSLRHRDWTVGFAARYVTNMDFCLSAVYVLVANIYCADVRAYISEVYRTAPDVWLARVGGPRPILPDLPEETREEWEAIHREVAAARRWVSALGSAKSITLGGAGWADRGGHPANADVEITPEMLVEAERIYRRIAIREREREAAREEGAPERGVPVALPTDPLFANRAWLAELLGIEIPRPLGHLLPEAPVWDVDLKRHPNRPDRPERPAPP